MRKATIICLVLMMALATVGYGFAKWSDSVTATVSVNTGNVCVGIRDLGTNDDGITSDVIADLPIGPGLPNAGQPGADPQYGDLADNSEGKDVAKKVSENGTEKCKIGDTQYYDSVTETITNGYPWYGPTTVVEIANCGSIPVKIERIDTVASGDLISFLHIGAWTMYVNETRILSGTGENALYAYLDRYQLHAKDVIKLEIQQYLEETNANGLCPENASGTVTITVTASQWNEVNP
ncbi:MAG: hypothetical protein AB1500_12400 [Bacillota bacterium]